jgi:hypothetical protein
MEVTQMTTQEQTITALKQIGGSEWVAGTMHRFYFNDLATIYGLEYGTYNSGNVSWAKLDGVEISNGKATKILGSLFRGKVWYDMTDGQFHTKNLEYFDGTNALIDELKKRLAEVTNA